MGPDLGTASGSPSHNTVEGGTGSEGLIGPLAQPDGFRVPPNMRFPRFGVALAVGVVLLLTLPAFLVGVGLATGPSGAPPLLPGTTITTTLVLQPGHNASSTLWGTTLSPRANLLPNEADLVNATPDRTIL